MKRLLRHGLSLLFVLGLTLALWPAGQHLYGWWSQRQLMAQWPDTTHQAKTPRVLPAAAPKRASRSVSVVRKANRKPAAPWPPTRISIPDIGLDAVVVQGLDEQALARGPGHDPSSSLPGSGNCVIAGHRNVYGSWFYRIDELWAGSLITLRTPQATYNYQVLTVQTVAESDSTVRLPPTEPNAAPRLTLYTCTLPHTSNRIVITAQAVTENNAL
jgi:sortase A